MNGTMIMEWDLFGIIIAMWVCISLLCWLNGYAKGRIDKKEQTK